MKFYKTYQIYWTRTIRHIKRKNSFFEGYVFSLFDLSLDDSSHTYALLLLVLCHTYASTWNSICAYKIYYSQLSFCFLQAWLANTTSLFVIVQFQNCWKFQVFLILLQDKRFNNNLSNNLITRQKIDYLQDP